MAAAQRLLLAWLPLLSRWLRPSEIIVLIIKTCCNEECSRQAPFGRENDASWYPEFRIDQADWLTDITVRLAQEDRRTCA